jgi:hypothetical protein
MTSKPQETLYRTDRDPARLLGVVHRRQEPGWTPDVLADFIANKDYLEIVRSFNKEDVVKLVNAIDEVCRVGFQPLLIRRRSDSGPNEQAVESADWTKPRGSVLLQALGSICSATGQLPRTTSLSDGVERCGDIAVASGGFTDTWRGRYQKTPVALKAFRTYQSQELDGAQKVGRTNVVDVTPIS